MKNFIYCCILSYFCLIFLCGCVPGEVIKANFDVPGENIHADIDVEPATPINLKK